MSRAKVSVSIISYNQEDCIAQAIESALMQKTNFDYELVIRDDCSTDNTYSICQRYQEQYPDKIKLLSQDNGNLGMRDNRFYSINQCEGEYIAILDGDDYWTDENKLQLQVDFMEQNTDYAICFHNVTLKYDDHEQPAVCKYKKDTFTIEELCEANMIYLASCLYRNTKALDNIGSWSKSLYLDDWVSHIMFAQHGKIKYIDRDMAAYRVSDRSGWSSFPLLHKRIHTFATSMICNRALKYKYNQSFVKGQNNFLQDIVKEYIKNAGVLKTIKLIIRVLQGR